MANFHRKSASDHRQDTATWLAQNPQAAALFLQFAHQMVARKRRFGIALLMERVRWEMNVATMGDEFKVNNSHRAYIARWLIQQDPRIADFISLRKTKDEE